MHCGDCGEYLHVCAQCGDGDDADAACDKCGERYCGDAECANVQRCSSCFGRFCTRCTRFMPGPLGGDQCTACQPQWKRDFGDHLVHNPISCEDGGVRWCRSLLCNHCGSARVDAADCDGCGLHVCSACGWSSCDVPGCGAAPRSASCRSRLRTAGKRRCGLVAQATAPPCAPPNVPTCGLRILSAPP